MNAKRINDVTSQALTTEPLVVKLDEFLGRDVDELERALGRVRSSSFTELLTERDGQRDDAFVALRDFAKAQSAVRQAGSAN